VDSTEVGQDVRCARDVRGNWQSSYEPYVVQDRKVARVAHGDGHVAVIAANGQYHVAAGKVLRHRPGYLGIDLAVLQVCDRRLEMNAQYEGQLVLMKRALAYEQRAERSQGHPLRRQGPPKLIFGDQALVNQNFSEPAFGRRRAVGWGVDELEHDMMLGVAGLLGNGNHPTLWVFCPRCQGFRS